MFGHGSPITSRSSRLARYALAVRFALLCAIAASCATPACGDDTLQLRIAWGGGVMRQWSGTIALTSGQLSLRRPLGIEADEPGSIWVEQNRVLVRQRTPREYDGADVFVDAPLDAKLLVSMSADPRMPPAHLEIRLVDLLQKPFSRGLDDQNNRLLVRRAPGDMLRVRTPNDSLVFAAGEHITIDVKPHFLPVADGANVRIKSRLVGKTTGEEFWTQEHNVNRIAGDGTSPGVISLDIPAPVNEGVYDLIIEASERNPLRWSKPIATRQVQLIVLGEQSAFSTAEPRQPWTKVLEIDPANPGWTDRLKTLPLLPGWRQGPLGNGFTQIGQHSLGPVVQLGPSSSPDDLAWEAYPLSISKSGIPHVLEIEFPSDVAQTLGISILEPNAAGVVTPIGLDSGVYVSEPAESKPHWQKHRLMFWPRTKAPLLLITDRRSDEMAVYGKIRVLAGPNHLPPAFPSAFDRSERLFAAYLDRPLFNENFGAAESLDSWSGRSLDDWQTFYEGASRLVEYLQHTGYNGLMLAALSDGSTIYPSNLLQPTPCYDTGAFFDTGQDPYRKDALELVLRLFDREALKLIPTLQFSAPLPALEAMLRRDDPQAAGIQLVGADGRPWSPARSTRRGLGPHYNPLNPQVQEAMLAVVREVVERYKSHTAFSGLAVELSADGYAQLPGDAWGFDDATIAAFQRDKNVQLQASGPDRFAVRARRLLGEDRKLWLEWRAEKLADFHLRMQSEITRIRPDLRFYLVPTNMLDTPEAERELRPTLPTSARVEDALLAVGVRPALYRGREGVTFLRPHRIAPPEPVARLARDIALETSEELDRLGAEGTIPGSLFWHEPQKLQERLTSFEAKSPFGKDKTYAWLVSQLSPAGAENRRRFVRSLARLDSLALFDGGWLLPLGQEDALGKLIATYRRLPGEQFARLDCDEPVTVRQLVRDGNCYFYFVNDCRWPVAVSMQVRSPPGVRAEELSGMRRLPPIAGNRWVLQLEPFDLVGVRFPSKDVQLSRFEIAPPEGLESTLARRIDDLQLRLPVLESPPQWSGLKNPGFEIASRGQPANWTVSSTPAGAAAALVERQRGYQNTNAVHFTSTAASASLISDAFPSPTTGRLSLYVKLHVEGTDDQPALRLAVEGTQNGIPYSPFALVGAGSAVPIPSDWAGSQFILKIDDIPTSGLSDLRVRFDLIGPGAVWIDDVQLFHLEFSTEERQKLLALLAFTAFQLQNNKWGECQRELDGYWPRFLFSNVPLSTRPGGRGDRTDSGEEKQAARPWTMERMRNWWKR